MIIIKNLKGFTLVELSIVVALIGLLAVILIPKIINQKDAVKEAAVEQNMKTVQTLISSMINEYTDPEELASAIVARVGNTFKNPFDSTTGFYYESQKDKGDLEYEDFDDSTKTLKQWSVADGSEFGFVDGNSIITGTGIAYYNKATYTDFILDFDMNGVTNAEAVFRYIDSSNYYKLNVNSNTLTLSTSAGTVLQSYLLPVNPYNGTFYHYKIKCEGSKIYVYFENSLSPQISVTNTFSSSGYVGVKGNGNIVIYDNFKISDLSGSVLWDEPCDTGWMTQ